jgi:hypothetical protein
MHIASRLCSMCVVAECTHEQPATRADVGDAGLRAQAGRGSALEMRSAFCLDGSKRMFYIFVADNDVNRAVIAHFDVRRATLKRAIINPTRIAPSTSTLSRQLVLTNTADHILTTSASTARWNKG